MNLVRCDWTATERLLAEGVAEAVFPGAVLLVGRGEDVLLEKAAGGLGLEDNPPVTLDTVYDLASLTKPLITAACVLILASRGRLRLDDTVERWIPAFAASTDRRRREVTLRHLLSHCSGLPAYRPYYKDFAAADAGSDAVVDAVVAAVAAEPLESVPGAAAVYSDLGFILLGRVVELACGLSLDRFAQDELLAPLGAGAGFRPNSRIRSDLAGGSRARRAAVAAAPGVEGGAAVAAGPGGSGQATIAPCGYCDWRGGLVHGAVQDENAYAMGGVAGHAGLFACARDVHRLVAAYAEAAAASDTGGSGGDARGRNPGGGREALLDGALVRECWRPGSQPEGATWVLGWDTPSPAASSAGRLVSADAVGHLGYTGTSVWVDRTRGVHVVLLSNRVQLGRSNEKIRSFRPRIHDAVFAALDAAGLGAKP